MNFRLEDALPVLSHTPSALNALLLDLPNPWTERSEGPGTWSPYTVVGHLVHADRTNWLPRIEHLLREGKAVPFPAFDREAMLSDSKGVPLAVLLTTFAELRADSLSRLVGLSLTEEHMSHAGLHPQLGEITLSQLLATWVTHDLSHLGQIARIMARQYSSAVGPWRAYLPILGTP